jgi:hypothetical protein
MREKPRENNLLSADRMAENAVISSAIRVAIQQIGIY